MIRNGAKSPEYEEIPALFGGPYTRGDLGNVASTALTILLQANCRLTNLDLYFCYLATAISPTSRSSGVSPWGVRSGGRGPPRCGGRSGRAASRVSGSSKKSNSMSVSRSVIPTLAGEIRRPL